MKKYLLILSPIILFIIFFIVILFTQSVRPKNNFPKIAIPTPVPVSLKHYTNPLKIISINPADGSSDLPVNQTFTLSLSRTFNPEEISVSFSPPADFKTTVTGTSYLIHPNLSPNVYYSIFIRLDDKTVASYSFSTILEPGQQYQDTVQQYEIDNKMHNFPDEYLALFTPYQSNNITVDSIYSDTGSPYYSFTVSSNNITLVEAKNEFILWARSLGLTDSQISTLKVIYQ